MWLLATAWRCSNLCHHATQGLARTSQIAMITLTTANDGRKACRKCTNQQRYEHPACELRRGPSGFVGGFAGLNFSKFKLTLQPAKLVCHPLLAPARILEATVRLA